MKERPDAPASRQLYRLALLTAAVTFPLLCLGGLVTSLDAGLVFPDWPLSAGSLNPSGWTANLDQAAEHGHRLLGALVGLCALALLVTALRRRAPRAVRRLAWIVFAAVSLQGLLGGLRVTEQSTQLALWHGCFAQVVFCLMVATVWLTSRDGPSPSGLRPSGSGPRRTSPKQQNDARPLFAASVAVVLLVFLQLILGAQLRHVGGPAYSHILGAVITLGAVGWALFLALRRHGPDAPVVEAATSLAGLFLLQVFLGLIVFSTLGTGAGDPHTTARVVLPTLHLALGALILARALLLALHAGRRVWEQRPVAPMSPMNTETAS
ncbi:MAG: heme A synthase [Planctomycetota bacterium]|nr:COX15/CtaA family protein [Planctomycetota bacterium]